MEQNWAATFIFIHQTRVLKMGDERSFSLDSSVSQGSNFFTVELFPFFPIERLNSNLTELMNNQIQDTLNFIRSLLEERVTNQEKKPGKMG